MAYAAALFGDAVLRGLNGATATECAYVDSDVTDVPYFATKVKLGTEGECHCWRCWGPTAGGCRVSGVGWVEAGGSGGQATATWLLLLAGTGDTQLAAQQAQCRGDQCRGVHSWCEPKQQVTS
jgi:hypothetical protein